MGQTSYDAYTREMAVLPITIEMETKGVLISPEIHNELDKWRSELNECEMVLTDLAEGAKVGSKAMYEVLTSKGVIDASKLQRTDKGNLSYSRNTLPAAVTDSTVLSLLERRSELQKIVTTYLEPWAESANRNQDRLYPFFQSTRTTDYGARTGRFSSNLQQVPRSPKDNNVPNLRRMIIAEDGYVLIGRDFSSQEIRVAAHYAEGKVLKAYQENPSLDVHSFVIDLVFKATGVKLERQVAKAISFLKMYGGGPNAMAANLGISVDEAASFFYAYDAALPEFKELSKEVEALVKDQGFIRTWGGRKYGVEAPVRVGGRLRTFYYKLVNVLVQGSSADMTKEAMIRYHYHPLRDKRSRIMLTIHDELVLHCPEDCVVEEQERLRWAMDEIPGWEVPLLSEGAVGRTMGDLK